ncbi:MAG: type II toxin-antitoxin system prevent-host-death family antitoxin [Acidimicrobiales bacterium]|nr:type II toxin-antitoxin system prevent-host-death family antitoxin [Acidimicrobiales bacterium]
MDEVGIRDLRNQVASVVRRAGAGERIVITVDGRPAAQLGPITPVGTPRLADLIAAGLVLPPVRSAPPAPDALPVPVDLRLDRLLDELRGP